MSSITRSATTPPTDIQWHNLHKPQFFLNMTLISLLSRTLIYPVSLVKTKLQTQQDARYLGTSHAFRSIWRDEGVRGLYRGFALYSLGILPYQYVYVTALERGREVFAEMLGSENGGDHQGGATFSPASTHSLASMLAGCIASASGIVVCTPIDVLTQRLMIQTKKGNASPHNNPNAMQITRQIMRESGIRGLWRGTGASIASYAPSSALFWLFYDIFKRSTLSTWQRVVHSDFGITELLLLSSLCGCVAGACEAAATNILDVPKTRLQTASGDLPKSLNSMPKILRHMVREEGLVNVWRKGISARMLSHSITAGILVFSYEGVKLMSSGGRVNGENFGDEEEEGV